MSVSLVDILAAHSAPCELFVYRHVRLLHTLSTIPVSLLGEADDVPMERLYEVALDGVEAAMHGLREGGVLVPCSNMAVIMIV